MNKNEMKIELRKISNEIQENRTQAFQPNSDFIERNLDKANELFKNYSEEKSASSSTLSMAALDARILKDISVLGKEVIDKSDTFMKKNPRDLINHLAMKYFKNLRNADSEETSNMWSDLASNCRKYIRSTPTISFLTLPQEEKEVVAKTRERRKKDVVAEEVQPEKDPNKDQNLGELNSAEKMNDMKLRLKGNNKENGKKGVDFWKFVTSSKEESEEGFTETIQNVFKLAFLVKDGHAKTIPGTKLIAPANPPSAEEVEKSRRSQMILKLDYQTYLKALQYCKSDNGEIEVESINRKITERRRNIRVEFEDGSQLPQMELSNDEEIVDEIIVDESSEEEVHILQVENEKDDPIGSKRKNTSPQPSRKKGKTSSPDSSETELILGTSHIQSQFSPTTVRSPPSIPIEEDYEDDFDTFDYRLQTQPPSNISRRYRENDNNYNYSLPPSQAVVVDLLDSDTEIVELEEVKNPEQILQIKKEIIKNEAKKEEKKENFVYLWRSDPKQNVEVIELSD